MPWRDNLHSKLVAWMKITLPLAALGILSTLFLISDGFDPTETLPMPGTELDERAGTPGAHEAVFAGVTRKGHEVMVRTNSYRPTEEDPRIFEIDNVRARYQLKTGSKVRIDSGLGQMNQPDNSAVLSDDVHIRTSTGYTLTTDRLFMRFDTLYAESAGPVAGKAPAGDLKAGRMVLNLRSDTSRPHLVFSDGVKLIYQPQNPGD